jgi:hypothetical protein
MTTQYVRLLHSARGQPDLLLEQLRQMQRTAEQELARRYNACHSNRVRHILIPDNKWSYDDFDPVLLALLWGLAENQFALCALARRFDLTLPDTLTYAMMCPSTLNHLWQLGRDGNALVEWWTREKKLPVPAITADTSEDVLGLLCWFSHGKPEGTAAWNELLRRYGLFDILRFDESDARYPGAEARFLERFRRSRWPQPFQSAHEFASVFADKLFHLVPRWDYVAFPSIEHMLVRAVENFTRDQRRRNHQRRAEADASEQARGIAEKGRGSPSHMVEVIDLLVNQMDVDERLIRKALEGIDLNDEELDHAARCNLKYDGFDTPTQKQVDDEVERLAEWLASNRGAKGQKLRECLPWFRPTRFGKEARLSRLQRYQSETRLALTVLLKGAGNDLQELAERVNTAAEKLRARTASGNRPSRKQIDPQSPVACFEEYDTGWRELLHQLGNRRLSDLEDDSLASARDAFQGFGNEFPILVKLAACRQLVGELPNAPALSAVASWLDAGTRWLSSFRKADRQRVAELTPALKALLPTLQGSEHAALRLLLLWLHSTDDSGLPDARLLALTRVWRYCRELPSGIVGLDELTHVMVEQAAAGKWRGVGETAHALLAHLGEPPDVSWSVACELRCDLERLRIRWGDLPARLKACRVLLDYGKKNASEEVRKWLTACEVRFSALPETELVDAHLALEVRICSEAIAKQANGGLLSALRLLALWTEPAPESRFSEAALRDLDKLWWFSHDAWHDCSAEVAVQIEALIEAATRGDWQQLASRAASLLRGIPDLSLNSRLGTAQDFRNALTRLARRRGQRGCAPQMP